MRVCKKAWTTALLVLATSVAMGASVIETNQMTYTGRVAISNSLDVGVSTNRLSIDTNGFLSFDGDAQAWNDINTPGTALGAGTSAPDLIPFYASGNIRGYGFDGSTTLEQLYGDGEILHDWTEGGSIYPHIHWMPTTTATGSVIWFLEYTWTNSGDSSAVPATVSCTNSFTNNIIWTHQMSHFPAIGGEGKTIGSSFSFRLYRDPAGAGDVYPGDAALRNIGIHYRKNTVGSRSIGTK
jgi:hypothetical protein